MRPTDASLSPDPQDATDAGRCLQQAREQRGLSVGEAAESLRLDPKTIEAIEAGQFSVLGPTVFAKGHLTHYATLLHLDPATVMALYEKSHTADPGPEPFSMAMKMTADKRWRKVLLGLGLAALLAAGAAVLLWWLGRS